MIDLDSARWQDLEHAYGRAGDIPALLAQLQNLPSSGNDAEPWFSIWSALAHQDDVYSASFAAVPHVIAALARQPAEADDAFFHFPAWVEICRVKKGVTLSPDLAPAYFESLARLPTLAATAATKAWSGERLACVLGAIAAAKGHHAVAEAALELTSVDVAESFMTWLLDQ